VLLEISGERTGNITMFGDVATTLLKMMGQSGQPEGAIRESDVPAALASLTTALDKLPADQTNTSNSSDDEPAVSLKTRASPLLKLLEQSIEKGGYVMWKPL